MVELRWDSTAQSASCQRINCQWLVDHFYHPEVRAFKSFWLQTAPAPWQGTDDVSLSPPTIAEFICAALMFDVRSDRSKIQKLAFDLLGRLGTALDRFLPSLLSELVVTGPSKFRKLANHEKAAVYENWLAGTVPSKRYQRNRWAHFKKEVSVTLNYARPVVQLLFGFY